MELKHQIISAINGRKLVHYKGAEISIISSGSGYTVEVGKGAYSKADPKTYPTEADAQKAGIKLIDSGAVD